jgi:hypothetical protein
MHRLSRARIEVDDAQSPVPEKHARLVMLSLGIWAAMRERAERGRCHPRRERT